MVTIYEIICFHVNYYISRQFMVKTIMKANVLKVKLRVCVHLHNFLL